MCSKCVNVRAGFFNLLLCVQTIILNIMTWITFSSFLLFSRVYNTP